MKSYSILIIALIYSLCPCQSKRFANPLAKVVQAMSKFRVNAVTVDRIINRPVDFKLKQPLDVRIDDTWYDLSGWRKAHPAGEHWIDLYRGRDATEVMHAFHSTRGRGMYARLPKSSSPDELNAQCAPVSQLTRNFRILRQQLEDQGWWKRDMVHESKLWAIWLAITVSGLALAKTVPLLAIGLLALSQTQAGWLAHDYVHGVDKLSFAIRNFGPLGAGLSPTWWSDKHNKVSLFSSSQL
jgi:acyl-lipid Delta6-acetylenase / acyl-lipid (9-3)-desaturase